MPPVQTMTAAVPSTPRFRLRARYRAKSPSGVLPSSHVCGPAPDFATSSKSPFLIKLPSTVILSKSTSILLGFLFSSTYGPRSDTITCPSLSGMNRSDEFFQFADEDGRMNVIICLRFSSGPQEQGSSLPPSHTVGAIMVMPSFVPSTLMRAISTGFCAKMGDTHSRTAAMSVIFFCFMNESPIIFIN